MEIPELYDLVIERLLKGKLWMYGCDYGNYNGITLIAILLFMHGYDDDEDYLIRFNSTEITEELDHWMYDLMVKSNGHREVVHAYQ